MIPRLIQLFVASQRRRSLAVLVGIPLVVVSCGSDQPGSAGPGLDYRHDKVSREPWSIHIAKMERGRRDLELHSTLARGTVVGLSTLVDQVSSLPSGTGLPLAAVNGDFYVVDERNAYHGDPRGLQILDGELVSAPTDQASFWIDTAGVPQATNVTSQLQVTWPNGATTPLGVNEERGRGEVVLYTPRLGSSTKTRGGRELVLEPAGDGPWLPLQAGMNYTARVRETRDTGNTALGPDAMVLSLGPTLATNETIAAAKLAAGAVLKISTATFPDLKGVKTAISGGYVLVRDGKIQDLKVPRSGDYKYRSVFERHPRSAIGASRDFIYLLQVDGRQPGHSVGMTLAELGEYMQKLGCELVLNLDGGASATFWLKGKVVNIPSNGPERPIANGLVVVKKSGAAAR